VYEESARHRLPLLPRDLPERLADYVDGHVDVGRDLREGGVQQLLLRQELLRRLDALEVGVEVLVRGALDDLGVLQGVGLVERRLVL
jgi:hypothetical protein